MYVHGISGALVIEMDVTTKPVTYIYW